MRVEAGTALRWWLLGSMACADGISEWSETRLPTHRRTAPEGAIPIPPPPTLPTLDAPTRPTGARTLPGGYPDTEPTVAIGQMVLLPGRATADRYFLHPDLPVHYELGTVVQGRRGESDLMLVSRTGAPTQVPGALVVPLGTDETPTPGTWVLMPRASGYGWTRAVVTIGASDSVLLAPVPADPEVGTLSATRGLIVPITRGDVGATLACRDAEDAPWSRVTVFGVAGNRLLHLDDNDRLGVHHASACIALELEPEIAVGDTILASHFGVFEQAKVLEVTDGGFGVRVVFDSTGREITLPMLDVATVLDAPGTGFSKRRVEAPPVATERPKLADAPVVLETIPSNATETPITEAEAEAAADEELAGDATEGAPGDETTGEVPAAELPDAPPTPAAPAEGPKPPAPKPPAAPAEAPATPAPNPTP